MLIEIVLQLGMLLLLHIVKQGSAHCQWTVEMVNNIYLTN